MFDLFSIGSSIIGGIGNLIANKDAGDRAAMLQEQAMQEWIKINIPDVESQKIVLDKFIQQGIIDPILEKAIEQDPSEFSKIVSSSENLAAQRRALAEIEKLGLEGGLRLQDKATIQDAMLEGQVKDRANRMAISDEMARRGLGGSGFEVASKLQGQQATADRDAQNRLSVAAKAQDRALQALMQSGELSTQYRNQDFQQQAAKAAAQDSINRFNTANSQDVMSKNTALQNRAMEANLAQKQKTADQNTALSNYEQEYNKGVAQRRFENETKIAAGKTGQLNNQAGLAIDQGKNAGNFWSNIGAAGVGAATAASQRDFWDKYFAKK